MLRFRPALQIVGTFLVLIILGTSLLTWFGFHDHVTKPPLLAAAFSSVSAVCVTGLSVIDIGTEMTVPGQVVLLLLIQLGGLGVLTLSNWILLFLRGRVSLMSGLMTRETLGDMAALGPGAFLSRIFLFTFAVEAVGTVLLFSRLVFDQPVGTALWHAVFHSVSAFCNAGFSLYGTSLERYAADPIVNLTTMGLIVLGGLGYVVAIEAGGWVKAVVRRKRKRLSLHARVVLTTTALLIFGGALAFAVLEWRGAAFEGSAPSKVLQSLFLSVTSRTAGFNTVPTHQLTVASMLFLVLLMFIGASPGSTGGGIKTTTAVVIARLLRSWIGNRSRVEIGDRTVPTSLVNKALVVASTQASLAFVALLILQITERVGISPEHSRAWFLDLLFEVMSAIGTVGLSTGVTAKISTAGDVVLMILMFAGRVGPLALVASIVGEKPEEAYSYPEEDLLVG